MDGLFLCVYMSGSFLFDELSTLELLSLTL
jgi:hypothetical protein